MRWVIHTGNFIHDFAAGCELEKMTVYLKRGHYELLKNPPLEQENSNCPFHRFKEDILVATFKDPDQEVASPSIKMKVEKVLEDMRRYVHTAFQNSLTSTEHHKPKALAKKSFFTSFSKPATLGFAISGISSVLLAYAGPSFFMNMMTMGINASNSTNFNFINN